jgi:hypothetical protein
MAGEVKIILAVDDIVVDNIVNRLKVWMGEEFIKLRSELADELVEKIKDELSSDFSDVEDKIDEVNFTDEIDEIKDVVDEVKTKVDSVINELKAEKVFVFKRKDEKDEEF